MTRRTRFIAGIFACVALTFSFAESVWASTCGMPGMTVEAEAEATSDAPVPGDPSCPGHPGHRAGERDQDTDHEDPCPFSSPLAAQACTGFISIAAGHGSLPDVSFEGAAESFALDPDTGLLLRAAVFRPPRA